MDEWKFGVIMKILHSPNKLFQPQLSTNDFGITVVSQSSVVGNVSSSVSVEDIYQTEYLNGVVLNTCNIYPYVTLSEADGTFNFTSINPSVATVDSFGTVNWVSNGEANINVYNNKRTRQVAFPVNQVTASSNVVSSFTTNSLAFSVSSSVNNLINGLLPTTQSYNLLQYIDDANKIYQWNPNLWCKVDLTCIPVLRNDDLQVGKGVLVSSDILITANHVTAGNKYYFLDKYNTTVSASVSSSYNIPNTDILVVRLASPVTASVKPAKVLDGTAISGSINRYFSTSSLQSYSLPAVFTNQYRTMKIGVWTEGVYFSTLTTIYRPSNNWLSWYSPTIGGDSGNVFGTIINNEFIALGTWYKSNLTSYAFANGITYYIGAINTAIQNLGSNNLLTTASLTGFPSY